MFDLVSNSNIGKYIRKPNKKAVFCAALLYIWALISTNIAFHGVITKTIFCCRILYGRSTMGTRTS